MSDLAYGVVVDGRFHSRRMARQLRRKVPNGVYSMDMGLDDFEGSLQPADMALAATFFRKASRTDVVRGVTFRDGMVPENPVAYPTVPVKVIDPAYDDFEEVEVISIRNIGHYFLRTVETDKAYALLDLKARLATKGRGSISDIKGVTPAMRVAYALHLMEIRRKERVEPVEVIKATMAGLGVVVAGVKRTNRGFTVSWEFEGHRLVTLLDKQFRVVNAGYCVNQNDRILSMRSVVNVLKDGVRDGERINPTLAADDGDFLHAEDDDEE